MWKFVSLGHVGLKDQDLNANMLDFHAKCMTIDRPDAL